MDQHQAIILSTHLTTVALSVSQRTIVHRWTGVCLQATAELLEFLDYFKQPRTLLDLRRRFSIEKLEMKIRRLLELGFLLPVSRDEEILWLQRNVDVHAVALFQTNHFIIFSPFDSESVLRPLAGLLERAYRFLVTRGLGRWRRPALAFICQTAQEYQRLWGNASIPSDVAFFVTKGRILAIAPWIFSCFDFSVDSAFKTMVHEMVHIFLCQRHAHLPLWAVEGICQYFSQPDYPVALADLMVSKCLLSFQELERRAVHSLLDIDAAPAGSNIGYRQAHSFIDFLARTLGEERLLACIFDSGLSKDFQAGFQEHFAVPLERMQMVWREMIGRGVIKT